MSEPIVLDQAISSQLQTPAKNPYKKPLLFAIFALVLLEIASAIHYSSSAVLFSTWSYAYPSVNIAEYFYLLTDAFSSTMLWYLCGLLLPVCLLLAAATKKPLIAKLFFFVAVYFTLMQVFCAGGATLVTLILPESDDLLPIFYELRGMFYTFPGSTLFDSFVSPLSDYSHGYEYLPGELFSCLLEFVSSLLYILKNVLCCIGFAVLGFKKNK